MNLKNWEATIQQITDEISLAPKEAGRHRVLTAWRAKLEKEPMSVPLFQVDEIVREGQETAHGGQSVMAG